MSFPFYAFEITLQARPAEATAGPALTDAWGAWPTLEVPKAALATPLAVGFDAALERLGAIERLYAPASGRSMATPPSGMAGCCSWISRGAVRRRSLTGSWKRLAGPSSR